MQHGIAILTQRLQEDITTHPDWVHVHLDIGNAFTSVSRQRALNALAQVAPALAGSQKAWLSNGTYTCVPGAEGTMNRQPCLSGIAQGDPLSSATFGILLQCQSGLLLCKPKPLAFLTACAVMLTTPC